MMLKENPNGKGLWTIHIDGSSSFKGSRLGLILTSLIGDKIEYFIHCGFKMMN